MKFRRVVFVYFERRSSFVTSYFNAQIRYIAPQAEVKFWVAFNFLKFYTSIIQNASIVCKLFTAFRKQLAGQRKIIVNRTNITASYLNLIIFCVKKNK